MNPRTLPCGRDPIDVWDHAAAADHLDGHEQTCTYCQGVVSEHRMVSEPVRRWRDQPIEAPTSLLERVMSSVRAGLRARNYLPLASPGGPVNIDIVTAEAALRWSLDQTPDARARSCRVELQPRAAEEPIGGPPRPPVVSIDLSITARFGADLALLAADTRRLVRAVATEVLGLDVAGIDILVADLYHEDLTPPRPEP